jgi:transcriptional regulator with XRE-family HTH domain
VREVSPELSDHLAILLHAELKARKSRIKKYSQNKMAGDIGIPTGTLSTIMNGKKGIGEELLPKFLAFFGKTREQLEGEAEAPRDPPAKLSRVRDSLYQVHSPPLVDRIVMASEFLDGVKNEGEALAVLSARLVEASAASRASDLAKAADRFSNSVSKPKVRRNTANK